MKALGSIQKHGHWVLYELKPRDFEQRLVTCGQLLQHLKRKGFLHRIVTGDENYDNPCIMIGGKAEYPWFETSALHLVRSYGCSLLWATQTDQNHHGRSLSTTIDAFEPSIEGKTAKWFCNMTTLSHILQNEWKLIWKRLNGKFNSNRSIHLA